MMLYSNVIGKGNNDILIILHGFLGMGDNWKSLARKIAEQNFEVHLIDARNHGRSFHDDDFSYEVMVEDLQRYCKHHGINQFSLLGHSMGGKTAMLFAANYGEMVSKLIVVDIAPRFYPIHHQDILNGLAKVDAAELDNRSEADAILANYVEDVGTRQFLLKNLNWNSSKILSLRLNLVSLTEHVGEVGEALPSDALFNKSTLFLRGEKSEYIASSDEADIKRHFPKAIIRTVSKAGHWLHAENPDEFMQFLIPFLLN